MTQDVANSWVKAREVTNGLKTGSTSPRLSLKCSVGLVNEPRCTRTQCDLATKTRGQNSRYTKRWRASCNTQSCCNMSREEPQSCRRTFCPIKVTMKRLSVDKHGPIQLINVSSNSPPPIYQLINVSSISTFSVHQ